MRTLLYRIFSITSLILLGGIAILGMPEVSAPVTSSFNEGAVSANSIRRVVKDQTKEWYEGVYRLGATTTRETAQVHAGVVPHHLITARAIAAFFSRLEKQDPKVVVVIGPNHAQVGPHPIVTSLATWETHYGDLSPATHIITPLSRAKRIKVEERITDHSISALVPFIKKTWPEAKVVPILVKNNASSSTLDALVDGLATVLPKNSIVLASIDFSHHQPSFVADYHDALALNVLRTGNEMQIYNLEIDSQASMYALLKYNELTKAEHFNLVAHTNSAEFIDKPDATDTTSHILGYFTKGLPDNRKEISVQFFGDMMIERNVEKVMGKEGIKYLLKNIAGGENRFFTGQDLIVANLEGPFAPSRIQTTKEIAFRFDPKYVKELKQYGFDAFSLANNHSVDMGSKNVTFTQNLLKENGFGYFGNQFQETSSNLWVAGDKNGLPEKVAFLGFNTTGRIENRDAYKKLIDKAKEESRYVIIFMHWGNEYQRISNNAQRDLARWFIDNGATAVIGAHPHVVQEIEDYKGRPIVYSLGNFIFDQYFSKDTQEGYSAGFIFSEGRVKEIHIFPFYGKRSQVNLMLGKQRDEFMEWMNNNSRLGGKKFIEGVLVL